jgi:hypothetical protein
MRSPAVDISMMADPESPRQMRQVSQARTLGRLNQVLVWCCVGLAAGAASCYFNFQRTVPLNRELPAVSSLPVEAGDKVALKIPVTDGRTAQIKNLFEPMASTAGAAGIDISSQFKVVGIILDRNPQAVLKDKQTGKSFFVHKGDRLGETSVGDIQDGKVVLSFESKNWELRP